MIDVNKLEEYKQSIAHSFSRSAPRYNAAAKVQQQAGKKLLETMQQYITANDIKPTIADVGCGTGCFYADLNALFKPSEYMGIDLAEGMLSQAKNTHCHAKNAVWLCDDAEYLHEVADNSLDIIFSNFALQWVDDLPQLMSTFWRVLKPGGYCCFTSLGKNTLLELRESWQGVDKFQHVNDFYDADVWKSALDQQGFNCLNYYQQELVNYYADVQILLRSIRDIGANVVKRDSFLGLMGKQHFEEFSQAYESFRQEKGLPASYIVDGWVLNKPLVTS